MEGKIAQADKALDEVWQSPPRKYHAHFDCFSGAAGDMLLASCLDAAGQQQRTLLKHVVECIKLGMPELSDEFDIKVKRVWRGALGSIAGLHVTVVSRYNHVPAPVPVRPVSVLEDDGKDAIGVVAATSHACQNDTTGSQSHPLPDSRLPEVPSKENGMTKDLGSRGNTSKRSIREHGHTHEHDNSHIHRDSNDDPTEVNLHREHSRQRSHGHSHAHSHGHSHEHSHGHSHGHSHARVNSNTHTHRYDSKGGPLRNLPEIRKMLEEACETYISPWVREMAIDAFSELAMAEARTHGAETVDSVHFHEVGAVDSIVDTVGTLIALHALGVESVSCSRLPLGEGTVWTDHGLLPVPAPATLRLLVGLPTCQGPPGVTGELITPTGAALLRALTKYPKYPVAVEGRAPNFTIRQVGIGAGTKDFEKHPNVLRLFLGDTVITKL